MWRWPPQWALPYLADPISTATRRMAPVNRVLSQSRATHTKSWFGENPGGIPEPGPAKAGHYVPIAITYVVSAFRRTVAVVRPLGGPWPSCDDVRDGFGRIYLFVSQHLES